MVTISDYSPAHETSWLRCRVLAFLDTCYYDDVFRERPTDSQVQLVALSGAEVVGILDVAHEGALATIDTIAVHPDHRREGIADRLLAEGLGRLPTEITELDAWTREDEAALGWYRSRGFSESSHYLHVHKSYDDPADGFASPAGLSAPILAHCHAQLADEEDLRAKFRRVYACRRFAMPVVDSS